MITNINLQPLTSYSMTKNDRSHVSFGMAKFVGDPRDIEDLCIKLNRSQKKRRITYKAVSYGKVGKELVVSDIFGVTPRQWFKPSIKSVARPLKPGEGLPATTPAGQVFSTLDGESLQGFVVETAQEGYRYSPEVLLKRGINPHTAKRLMKER